MTKENEELTFSFADDGKEYKVDDLSDEHKLIYNKVMLVNRQKNEIVSNANFEVENTNDDLLPFLLTIPLQKLAYYSALKKGYDIDKPRNLAKSVTVE